MKEKDLLNLKTDSYYWLRHVTTKCETVGKWNKDHFLVCGDEIKYYLPDVDVSRCQMVEVIAPCLTHTEIHELEDNILHWREMCVCR